MNKCRLFYRYLRQVPCILGAADYKEDATEEWAHHGTKVISTKRELVGVDVYLYSHEAVDTFQQKLNAVASPSLKMTLITNRGAKVWPGGVPETFCTDHWRCRFESKSPIDPQAIPLLLQELLKHGFDIIKTENLYTFDGHPGFSHT